MRVALVSVPGRCAAWAGGLEVRGWVVDVVGRDELLSSSRSRAALEIADGIVLDAGDLDVEGTTTLRRLEKALPREADVVILSRALAGEGGANRRVVYEEDGLRRGVELLDLWLNSARAERHRATRSMMPPRGNLPGEGTPGGSPSPSLGAASAERSTWDRRTLDALCDALVSHEDARGIMQAFTRALAEAYGLARYVLFYGEVDPAGWLAPVVAGGMDDSMLPGIRLSRRSGVGRLVCDRHAAVHLDLLDPRDPAHAEADRELRWLGLDAAVPVSAGQRIVAILLVGRRLSGDALGARDIESMAGLCRHVAHAVARADARAARSARASLDAETLRRFPAGVTVLNAAGNVLQMNAAARHLLDMAGEAEADHLRDLPAYIADRVTEGLDTGTPVSVPDAKDPVTGRVVDIHVVPWEAEGGRLAVLYLWDRTGHAAREREARNQWQDGLLQRVAERSSHEFGNALVALRTFAELLPEQYDNREFREEFAGVVAREVERVQRFLAVLDSLAHPPAAGAESADLAEILAALCDGLREEFGGRVRDDGVTVVRSPGGRPVEIDVACGEDARTVPGSAAALQCALANIARNAIQAMPRGGTLSMTTARRMDDAAGAPCVEIIVEDEGEGILLAHQDEVFEPFFTTRHVGVGLGLTVVKSVVERHRGSIRIESTRGRGTAVIVRLPERPPSSGADGAPRERRIDLPEPGGIRLGSDPAEGSRETP